LQIAIPETHGFMNPKFVTTGPHAVEYEILAANPGIKDFTHIGPNSLEAFLLRPGELALLTLVVGTVELIDNEMLDFLESFFDAFVSVNMGLEVACVIMDDGINLDLLQLHGCLYHLHFVRKTFIDNMFFGCNYLP